VGTKYIGFYSPERSFLSVKPQQNSIQFEYFSRGDPLPGTKVASKKASPRWGVFIIKQSDQVTWTIDILKEAHSRLKAAMKEGEPTGYFSGGQKPVAEDPLDEENSDK
jgi:hypothetical protein